MMCLQALYTLPMGSRMSRYEDHRALPRWRTPREEGSEGPS